MYQARISRIYTELSKVNLSQTLITDPKSIWYLTGISLEPMERFFGLYLNTNGQNILFLNNMFTVPKTGIQEIWLSDTDNVPEVVANAIDKTTTLGVDKNLKAKVLLPLMELCPETTFKVASPCVDNVRAQKDSFELDKLRLASEINDKCMEQIRGFIRDGVTEIEVATEINRLYKELGAECMSFTPIVAFGPHAADPHHSSDNTVLKEGDCILIDTGCVKDDYCSDMTRTYFWKKADEKYLKLHDICREANEAAENMIKPGVRFCDIDKTARDHISSFGYGENFTHRLGHSIGCEAHEFGDVGAKNTDPVAVGNVFSIEPGIYLPDEFGVRIEDLVIVTETGCEIINKLAKNYEILGI